MIDATLLLRAYAAWRRRQLASEDPVAAQRRELLRLIDRAKDTRFGRAHQFGRIDSVAAFQARVPLRRYEDFWRDWWQPAFPTLTDVSWPGTMPYFAATSGTTTGVTKYIPVSRAMLAANRRAVLDVFTHHLTARPDSRVLGGRNFMLGGSTALTREAAGVYSGDLSGIAANEVPWWARRRFFPPRALALIADWERKLDALAPASLTADIRTLSGTPSWVLLFLARVAALRPDAPARVSNWYPHLELFIHGGVAFAPYRAQFEDLFAGSRVDMREVYPASEGFLAVADRGFGEGLRLLADNGLFLEFVPADEIDAPNARRHWLADVECGVNYAVVVSSNAGLFGYVLGDTVRFVQRRPPRVLVTGRLSYTLSAFGEHVIGEELDAAVQAGAAAIGVQVVDYAVAAIFPHTPAEKGRHCFVVEFAAAADAAAVARFAAEVDRALAAQNADYAGHRVGMQAPEVIAAAPGTFTAWMRARGRIGGQNKVPRVIADAAMLAGLKALAAASDETRQSASISRRPS